MNQNKQSMRPFFVIWTGQAFSLLGSMLVHFALIWWLTQTTGSATVLATASLAGFLPQVLLGPFAGVLVDRWNRKHIMLAADGVVAAATAVLAYLFWIEAIQIWHVYAVLLVRAMAGSFHWPAMAASTTLMVPQEHLTRIQGLNQALNGGMNIAAAPLGALLLELLPLQGVLAIDVTTALLAMIPLLFVFVPQPQKPPKTAESPSAPSFWGEMKAGFTYIRAWPGLLVLIGIAMIIKIFLNPATSLLPLLVKDHFNGTAWHLSAIEAAWGIGAISGGVLLGVWGGFKRRTVTMLTGIIGIGVCLFLMGIMPAALFLGAVFAMFAAGVTIAFTDGPLMAIMQTAVSPDMQGRVFMLFGSLVSSTVPIGLLLAGPVSDALGVQLWFIMAGVVTALGGAIAFLIPAFMNLENNQQTATPELPIEAQTA